MHFDLIAAGASGCGDGVQGVVEPVDVDVAVLRDDQLPGTEGRPALDNATDGVGGVDPPVVGIDRTGGYSRPRDDIVHLAGNDRSAQERALGRHAEGPTAHGVRGGPARHPGGVGGIGLGVAHDDLRAGRQAEEPLEEGDRNMLTVVVEENRPVTEL